MTFSFELLAESLVSEVTTSTIPPTIIAAPMPAATAPPLAMVASVLARSTLASLHTLVSTPSTEAVRQSRFEIS